MITIQPDTSLPKPKKVKVYEAVVYQTGTTDPVATELLNTTGGSVTWTRVGIGYYDIIFDPPITDDEIPNTSILMTVLGTADYSSWTQTQRGNFIQLTTINTATTTPTDGYLNCSIEVKIYS